MESSRGSGIQSGNWNSVNENCGLAKDGMCDKETFVHTNVTSNRNEIPFQFKVESEPPRKRAKNDLLENLTTFDHKKAVGNVLYKTRLCFQFCAGSCPFVENCEFAHSMVELRELPHNWQEIIAAHKEEKMESQEHCKGLSSKIGARAPYGEKCSFIHNEHEHCMERKSAAICLLPSPGGGCERNGSKLTLNPSNWKTRICNKWESTWCCAYGQSCIFAHGFAEMQYYGGWLANEEGIGPSALGANQVAIPAKSSVGTPPSLVPYSYHIEAPRRRLPVEIPKTGELPIRSWKGYDKISKIYGDWIDDLE